MASPFFPKGENGTIYVTRGARFILSEVRFGNSISGSIPRLWCLKLLKEMMVRMSDLFSFLLFSVTHSCCLLSLINEESKTSS